MTPSVQRFAVLIVGFVVTVGGAVLVLVTNAENQLPRRYTAYAPLSNTVFVPPPPLLDAVGYVLIGLGLCLIAAWIGYQLGRERPRR